MVVYFTGKDKQAHVKLEVGLKFMRKILSLFLMVTVFLLLSSCGAKEVEKNDDGFLINFKNGLEERWAEAEKLPTTYTSNSAEKLDKLALIDVERNAIGNLDEYEFSNPDLKKLAEEYVAALESQADGLKYLGIDVKQYHKLFTENGYYVRASVISKLVYTYGLQVDSKYENNLNDFLDSADLYDNEKNLMQELEKILLSGIILEGKNMYDASAQMVNTTSKDITGLDIYLLSLDKAGNLLDTSMGYFESWKAGETKEFQPYLAKDADHYQMYFSMYSSTTGIEWKTEPVGIEYRPFDPGVEFVLRFELPSDYTPTSWYSKATCHVTDFWTELNYSDGEKSSFIFHIAGSKTYDARGDNYLRSCHVQYSVTNEDKSVVYDTGSFYTDEMLVGQSFTDCSSYVSDLLPGTYYVELFVGKY